MFSQSSTSQSHLAAFIVLLCLLLTFTADASPRSKTYVEPGNVYFETGGDYDLLTLNVGAPDGVVSSHIAKVTDSLTYSAIDDEGQLRPDGVYAYELKGVPSSSEKETLLASGYFTMRQGAFVTDAGSERLPNKDQVIQNENLIVAGNGCFGEDCVDGETFDLEQLQLKDNNVRIFFRDTSNTAEFPNRDWMLQANEEANGGANLFSIVDCGTSGPTCTTRLTPFTLEAGAPNNSLVVDDDGRLGLGTNVPEARIHTVDGNTPGLRLDQDGSNGFSPQVWDIAGNESNFFIRDTTNSSNLVLRIATGAPNNAISVRADGNVGLGDGNPSERLDVAGNIILTGTVNGRDVAADGAALDTHMADFNNPHQVTAEQVGAISQAALDAHTGNFNNPHQVTAEQTGAISQAALDAHTGDFNNPHQVTADQVGAVNQATLDAHTGNFNNPHQVTAAQAGAEVAGAAAAAVAAHEAAFDHSFLASGAPISIEDGGTGASDAATARANLGIEDDPTRTGILPPGFFTGSPATAEVTFSSPYAAGTSYVVLLTTFSQNPAQAVQASLITKTEAGFTVALDGSASGLVEINWLARPITEATPTPPAPPAASESCTLGINDVWNNGYVLNNISVTNEGAETITSWSVVLHFAEPTTVTNSWNGVFSLSPDGMALEVTNNGNNGTLAPGQSTLFGFQGTHDGSFEVPGCSDL